MYLKKEVFEFYKEYFLDKDTEDIFIYLEDIVSIRKKYRGTIQKELYLYIQDKKEYDLIESRRPFYDENFFSLDCKNRPTVDELAVLLGVDISEVSRDLRYFGLKGKEYQNILKHREVEKHRDLYEGYLDASKTIPTYGQMSKEIGIPTYQIQKELREFNIEKGVYGSDIIAMRRQKIKDYFENLSVEVGSLTILSIASDLDLTPTTLTNDMKSLGIYEVFRNEHKTYANKKKKEKELIKLEKQHLREERATVLRLKREAEALEKEKKRLAREEYLKKVAEEKNKKAEDIAKRRKEKEEKIKFRHNFYLENSKDGILLVSKFFCCETLGIGETTFWSDLSILGLRAGRYRVKNTNLLNRKSYYESHSVDGELTIKASICAEELGISIQQVYLDLKKLGFRVRNRKGQSLGHRNQSEKVQKIKAFSDYVNSLSDDGCLNLTISQIEKQFECPFSSFKYWMSAFGAYDKCQRLRENARCK